MAGRLRGWAITVEFEARSLLSDRAGLIRTLLIEPLAYLLLLGLGLQGMFRSFDLHYSYLSFIFPGVVAMQFVRLFSYTIYRMTMDRRWGLQAFKLASGVGKTSYLVGMMTPLLGISILQFLTATVIAWLMGARGFLGSMALLVLASSVFWISLAMVISFFVRSYAQRDMWLTFLLLPMTFSAPVFYALDSAPLFLKYLSHVNPLTYQVEAMRSAFLWNEPSLFFWPVVIFSLLLIVLARFALERAEVLPSEV